MLYIGLKYEDLEREGFLFGYSNLCLRAVFSDDKLLGLYEAETSKEKFVIYRIDEEEVSRKVYGLSLLIKKIGWEKQDIAMFYSPLLIGFKKIKEKEDLIDDWSEFNVLREVKE